GAFFQKLYVISAQLDSDVSELLCVPAASAPEPNPESEPLFPELDPVIPEECCIPDPNISEPVSSEGLVDSISDAISELRSPMLVTEDLTDPEGSSGNDQSGTDASPETAEEDIPTGASAPEPTSEPMEPELDPVNPEEWCITEPLSSEGLVDDISNAILELRCPTLVFKDLINPEGPSAEVEESRGNNQSGADASPESTEEAIPTEYAKVRKISKISAFFQNLFGNSAQPQKDPAVPEPRCNPEASVPEQEPQSHIPQNISQLKNRLEECALSETPVTEVWPNVFLGNEDRTKLKKMGITHILNAAAVKKKLRVLMGMPKAKDMKGKINTGAKYYKGMKIKYCGLPTTHKDSVKMGMYFSPAAKFINKALRKPQSKIYLSHKCSSPNHSPVLLLAYLMIHCDMNVEEATDHVTKTRHIKPSVSFLTQLMSLNAELVEQRKQRLLDTEKQRDCLIIAST
ncbi:hypothetical protein M9458_045833, partial [Cirrhinus mrigala]